MNPAIRIEKGVILAPPNRTSPKWDTIFSRMKVGDSFAVEKRMSNTATSKAWAYSKKTKADFSIRAEPDGSIRIWRIK